MLSASIDYRKAIRENTKCVLVGTATFADGKRIDLEDKDFMSGATSFDDSTSASGRFEIGAAIMNTFSCTLNNVGEKFSLYDFTDAVIRPTVKKALDGSYELIPKGVFTVEQPNSISSTITITSYDNMKKFEKPYSGVSTTYPATVQKIINDLCVYCGMTLATQQFGNYNYVVAARPDDSAMTCLDVISYMAQMTGNYARANVQGDLELKWYDMEAFDDVYDGGSFSTDSTPYSDGVSLDGGNFTDYSSGDTVDSGLFTDKRPYNIYAFSQFQVCTDDVVITGIKVVTEDEEGNAKSYLKGSEGYVLSIENNPFVTISNYIAIATQVGNKIIGMRFRPFSVSALGDPTLEAGDAIRLIKNGILYNSYLTHVSYKMGGYATYECSAETPSANSAARYSAATQTYIKARAETKRQLTGYDIAVQRMNQLASNMLGLYADYEQLEDGSRINYQSTKPITKDEAGKCHFVADSIVYKSGADGFFVSQKGGAAGTYIAGFDSSGNAVVNVLNAIGINAGWITTGDLTVGGEQDNTDGKIAVYDKDGNILAQFDKSHILFNMPNFGIDTNGDVKIVGSIYGLGQYLLKDIVSNTDVPFIKYAYSTEDPQFRYYMPNGEEFLRVHAEDGGPTFLQPVTMTKAKINALINDTYTFSGSDDNGFSVSGTLIISGVFVLAYGTYTVEAIAAGDSKSCVVTTRASAWLPNHKEVSEARYIGKRTMIARIGTSGTFSIRNASELDLNTVQTVGFRFDYTLM